MGDLSGVTGNGIVKIEWDSNPSGQHAPGTLDKYKITYTSSDPSYFEVYNGSNGAAAGIADATASVDSNVGTPSVVVTTKGPDTAKEFNFAFKNLKGDKGDKGDTGDAAGFGTPTAKIDANVGTPSITITATGPDTAKVFDFDFKNMKGEQGLTGPAAGFGTPSATIGTGTGIPTVSIAASGPDTAKVFAFSFDGLKGAPGDPATVTKVQYGISDSATVAPTEWYDACPTP